jgi:magnesium and cobalt exporter, CNNM family
MDLYAALGALLILGLVAANGFFVATEFAIVAVRRSRLEQLAAEGNAGAGAAWQVVGHLDTYIAACQLGITMASLALGWVGEPALEHLIEPPLELIFGPLAPTLADGIALGLAFVLITALHIILGELAPKGLALQRPEGTALWVARPMLVFERVFRWPIGALNAVGNSVLRLFGLDPATGHEMVHSVEELRLLVTGSREAGVVEESEARIASRAFGFGELTAGELMTPRTELEAIPIGAARDELLRRVAASTHSRLPVYDGTLDNIVGVLHVHDLFAILQPVPDRFDLRPLIRPVLAVPASKSANDLLEEMRAARRQLAVAIDEYGGTAGIVTLEDLLEALVGPIEDEPPVADETRSATDPVEVGDGTLLYDGLMRLGEWEEATGRRLAASDHEHSDTLGGLIMARLGRIPRPGDEVVIADRTLRVERLDGKRVAAVRLID